MDVAQSPHPRNFPHGPKPPNPAPGAFPAVFFSGRGRGACWQLETHRSPDPPRRELMVAGVRAITISLLLYNAQAEAGPGR